MLEDGSYEALVIDVTDDAEVIVLSITVTAGAHKGEVIDVRAAGLHSDALDLLAMPCVLTVLNGEPRVVFD